VPTTVVQVAWPQGAEPSIQPFVGETHDCDWAWKPAGTRDRGAAVPELDPNAADPEPATVTRTARHVAVASSAGKRGRRDLRITFPAAERIDRLIVLPPHSLVIS
jgi:hypothetical protein